MLHALAPSKAQTTKLSWTTAATVRRLQIVDRPAFNSVLSEVELESPLVRTEVGAVLVETGDGDQSLITFPGLPDEHNGERLPERNLLRIGADDSLDPDEWSAVVAHLHERLLLDRQVFLRRTIALLKGYRTRVLRECNRDKRGVKELAHGFLRRLFTRLYTDIIYPKLSFVNSN